MINKEQFKKGLTSEEKYTFDMLYIEESKTFNTSLIFWFLGFHYLYFEKIGLFLLYFITGGGFLIWTIIDLFRLKSMVKSHNLKVCMKVKQLVKYMD